MQYLALGGICEEREEVMDFTVCVTVCVCTQLSPLCCTGQDNTEEKCEWTLDSSGVQWERLNSPLSATHAFGSHSRHVPQGGCAYWIYQLNHWCHWSKKPIPLVLEGKTIAKWLCEVHSLGKQIWDPLKPWRLSSLSPTICGDWAKHLAGDLLHPV